MTELELDVGHNNIGAEGGKAIAEALNLKSGTAVLTFLGAEG